MTAAIAGLFVLWLMLTVAYQFDAPARKLARWDIFRLLPRWTFFAPNPGHHDLHLLYRDMLGGRCGPWQEVDLAGDASVIPVLWNPGKRIAKILWDSWGSIQYLTGKLEMPADRIQLTAGYLVLLNMASRPNRSAGVERQFAIVRSTGFTDRQIDPLFLSMPHPI